MIKGHMVLKIVEAGRHKDVVIREGESFILPAKIPHSPQRAADTIGLVVERERVPTEQDGLRWYINDKSTDVLYERWFHCVDLGTQLKPIIEGFFASQEYRTRKPSEEMPKAPWEPDSETKVIKPVNVMDWMSRQELKEGMFIPLFGGGDDKSSFKSVVGVYGPGKHVLQTSHDTEQFLWQWKSDALVDKLPHQGCNGQSNGSSNNDNVLTQLSKEKQFPVDSVTILPKGSKYFLVNEKTGLTFSVVMPSSDHHKDKTDMNNNCE
jgi:3-hydroxyanthranilate 3,4-dioxygenase